MGHAAQAVCIGEAMALLVPEQAGPLEDVTTFQHSYGGAEANVARGLAALGFPSAWVSRVGADGFGRRIVRSLTTDGVHTSAVTVDPGRPTELYVKEIGTVATAVHYYRRGSAASALGPGLLDEPALRALLDDSGLVHVSGITAALSDSAPALLHRLLAEPRRGRTVSFDLDWRPALWRDRDPKVRRRLRLGHLAAASTLVVPDDHGAPPPHGHREELLGCSPAARAATRVTASGVTSL